MPSRQTLARLRANTPTASVACGFHGVATDPGGKSAERPVSLKSGGMVLAALRALGYVAPDPNSAGELP